MKCLCIVLLCSTLAIAKPPDGYPSSINIQKDIIGFLVRNDRQIFCSMVLITYDRGLAASTCFARMDTDTEEIYVLTDGLRYSERKQSRVLKVIPGNQVVDIMQPKVSVIMMNWEKKSNSAKFFKGIFQDDDYCLTNEDNLLSISGYSKINQEAMTFTDIKLEPNDVDYFRFCIRGKPTEMNIKGAPVFYKRTLLAICESDTDDEYISCLDVRDYSRKVFNSFIQNHMEFHRSPSNRNHLRTRLH